MTVTLEAIDPMHSSRQRREISPKISTSRCTLFASFLAILLFAAPALAETPLTIVSPDNPLPHVVAADSPIEQDAAKDLCNYLSRVSGRRISVSKEPSNAPVTVHVGRDEFVRKHVLEIEKLIGDGYVIKIIESTGRQHLVLAGKVDRAAQWAVEQFLKDHCGVRWLFPDPKYGEVVPSRPTITINSGLSKTYEPDFLSRANCAMYYFSPPRKLLRLRPFGLGYGNHAIQHIFSDDEFREHPEWFAFFKGKRQWWKYGNGWQICTTNPGTVRRAVEHIDDYFKKNPNSPVVSIGQNDGSGWCECAECTKFVNSVEPAYTITERWFHWVNLVAREAGKRHPGKQLEAMAYSATSEPPRFQLEPNVAITKTFVLDRDFKQAEEWGKVCKSVNLYSYMYGNSFMGFRHYPHAAQQFLKWGHEELGALSHVTECGGDWTFDGPKYYYLQALQWDVNADVDYIMDEFCEASYGKAAGPMRGFWDRLEEIYMRRRAGLYRQHRKDWLFYQWVAWGMNTYLQPNDEFQEYTLADVRDLDRLIANATRLATEESPAVQFRMERMTEAWKYFRTMLVSFLKYHPLPLETTIASEGDKQVAIRTAREIADLRRDRAHLLAKMRFHSNVNPRMAGRSYSAWGEALTIFSHENALIDELCTAVTKYSGKSAAALWRDVPPSDSLHEAAQIQLKLLSDDEPKNLIINGGFELGNLQGWKADGAQINIATENQRGGGFAARMRGTGRATLSQRVAVSPLERYRLTVWGRYLTPPPKTAVPLETILEFYDGDNRIWSEPTRTVLRTLDPADGWVRLRSPSRRKPIPF